MLSQSEPLEEEPGKVSLLPEIPESQPGEESVEENINDNVIEEIEGIEEDQVSQSGQVIKRPPHLLDYVLVAEVPATFEEAIKDNNSTEWKMAMDSELNVLQENKTWELVSPPSDARVLPCRWVFTVKLRPDGTTERYKARLVAKGF